jgi:hypothetical protein
MSFNPNDNNLHSISLANYEEYFLLYADNELTTAERDSVHNFILAHPQLQQELDLILQTKLPAEEITLENKETLLAHNMRSIAVDETLLLYIDNELNEGEKRVVEQKLKADISYQLQYELLLKTKPTNLDEIVYPYKKELYRYEEKIWFSGYWMRIAAAVIILLGMGIFVFTYQPKPAVSVAGSSKKVQPVKKLPVAVETKTDIAVETKTTKEVTPTVIKTGETDDVPNVVRNLKKKPQQHQIKKEIVVPSIENEQENVAVNKVKEPEQKIIINKNSDVAPQQTINTKTVTPPLVVSLNDQTTSPVTAVQRDVVKIDNEKKSSLKGFLRKATRFIERRTNITTTNENNELLIGAVSLKL